MKIFYFLLTFYVFKSITLAKHKKNKIYDEQTLYACMDKNDTIIIENNNKINCIAKATFKDTIYSTGWDTLYLEIILENEYSWYALGILEGILSKKKTRSFIKVINYFSDLHCQNKFLNK